MLQKLKHNLSILYKRPNASRAPDKESKTHAARVITRCSLWGTVIRAKGFATRPSFYAPVASTQTTITDPFYQEPQ